MKERASSQLAGLKQWRTDRFREAKQAAAAAGLHWGNYNAVTTIFEANVRAARHLGGAPAPKEDALGTALVNQIMDGATWGELSSDLRDTVGECVILPGSDPARGPISPQPGSRRASRDHRILRMTVRGRDNPLGKAHLFIPFFAHRTIPRDAVIKEVRAILRQELVHNPRTGRVWHRDSWSVVFVVDVPPNFLLPDNPRVCGLDIGWQVEGGRVRVATLSAGGAELQTFHLPQSHLADWERRQRLSDEAEASGTPDDRARLELFEARLRRRRKNCYREIAARIASWYSYVALREFPIPPGTKNHAAPLVLITALMHAVERAGGIVWRAEIDTGTPGSRARELYSKALAQVVEDGFSPRPAKGKMAVLKGLPTIPPTPPSSGGIR